LNKIEAYGLTDTGRVREENQDVLYIDEQLGLYIVADGLGGMQDGARASKYVVTALTNKIAEYFAVGAESKSVNIPKMLSSILFEVNTKLSEASGGSSGSTVVLAFLEGNTAYLINAGDSPAYLYRNKTLQCLTRVHNVAGILVEQGKITTEEAHQHPLRHQLTSYVGLKKGMILHENTITLEIGDRLLLCSDGLNSMVGEKEIIRLLDTESSIEDTVKALISAANEAGGTDNITALLIKVNQTINWHQLPDKGLNDDWRKQ
jgi:PPM family protein phosphatase